MKVWLDYIFKNGISTHLNFFTPEKFLSVQQDVLNLDYNASYQPFTNKYGNRMQAFPCYEKPYNKENNYIITKLENMLQVKIIKFETLARKIVLDEIKQSPQNFGKYGLIHKDILATDNEPLIAGMIYFEQSYNGGTAFFHNQQERTPDINISAVPNRLVLYSGAIYHAPCLDYTFKERYTLSFFFRTEKND